MKKYSLILSPLIKNTKIPVYELCKNNKSLFNEFVNQIKNEGTQFNDLSGTIAIIETASNLKSFNKTKYRMLKDTDYKIYEAKKNGIRVYLYHEKNTGRIIITGGKKNSQTKDIKKVINIIKAYNNEK